MIDKKKLLIIIAPIVIFFIVIIIISLIFLKTQSEQTSDVGVIKHQDITIFENHYQLDYSIGEENSSRVLADISVLMIDNNEVNSAPEQLIANDNSNTYYTCVLEEKSFRLLSKDNGYTYSFNLNVNDGRDYQIIVKTDSSYGSEYIIILIKRVGGDKSFIIIDSETVTLNDDIKAWAETLGFSNLLEYKN